MYARPEIEERLELGPRCNRQNLPILNPESRQLQTVDWLSDCVVTGTLGSNIQSLSAYRLGLASTQTACFLLPRQSKG